MLRLETSREKRQSLYKRIYVGLFVDGKTDERSFRNPTKY
jgi:hypothetical protein